MPQIKKRKKSVKTKVSSGTLKGSAQRKDGQHTKEEKDGTFTSNTIVRSPKGAYYHGSAKGGLSEPMTENRSALNARDKMVSAPGDSLRASTMSSADFDAVLGKKKKFSLGKLFKRKKK